MSDSNLFVSSSDLPLRLDRIFSGAYSGAPNDTLTRLGFAYASVAGLDILINSLPDRRAWELSEKRFLIGIDSGITEPDALRKMSGIPNSKVRFFLSTNSITKNSLRSVPRFHAKVISVDTQSKMSCLVVGSANLTWAALSEAPRNYEASLVLRNNELSTATTTEFNKWWSTSWSKSLEVTESRIIEYAKVRKEYLDRNPDVKAYLEPASDAQLRSARHLWIEAGAMSGGSRNQVEFSRDVVAFFGSPASERRFPLVRCNGQLWRNRPLSYKVTTYGVEIWRFSLPTTHQTGIEYPGRIIRFRKTRYQNDDAFEVDVAETSSSRALQWRKNANLRGYLGITSGNREFGFY